MYFGSGRNPDQHKMRYKQYKCACDTRNKCTLAYVVRSCEYTGKCKHFIWVSGEHIDDNVKLPNDHKTVQFGVPIFIQKIFEQYLEDDSTLSAKGLLHKLSKSRQINRQKKKEEQDKKLIFSKYLIPKINQVYILICVYIININ